MTMASKQQNQQLVALFSKTAPWSPSMEAALSSAFPSPSPNLLCQALKLQSNSRTALSLFQWASRHPRFSHTCNTYKALASVFFRLSDSQPIWPLLQSMQESLMAPRPRFFSHLISCYGDAGRFSDAAKVFSSIPSFHGFSPDSSVYNAMLRTLVNPNRCDMDHAFRLFHEMMASEDFPPNAFTFNIMAAGLRRTDQWDDALAMLSSMVENGYMLDAYAYTMLIDFLVKRGHFGEVLKLILDMTARHLKINPVTVNSFISHLIQAKMDSLALSVFNQLSQSGWKPTMSASDMLVDSLVKNGKTEEALGLLKRMGSKQFEPNAATYNSIISNLIKLEKGDIALCILLQMIESRCKPCTGTFNMVISWLAKAGKIDDALELFNLMPSLRCRPDVVTYNSVLAGLVRNKKFDLVASTFAVMQDSGCKATVVTYNILIDYFVKQGKVGDALEILEQMASTGCKPDVHSYNRVFAHLVKTGKLDEALSLVASMKETGCKPDDVTHTILVNHIHKAGHSNRILALLDCVLVM